MAKTPWPPPGRRTPASATAAPLRTALALLCACLLLPAALANTVDVGYDVVSAAQAMIRLASHSWEWGTAAEALLELYNPELSVFGSNPFPDGKVPHADPAVVALAFAGQFIELGRQTLVPDGAVGDPASLGVSAILLGQTAGAYLDAADSQADYLLHQAPKFSNGAISQRGDVAELWADFMFMAPPFRTCRCSLHTTPVLLSCLLPLPLSQPLPPPGRPNVSQSPTRRSRRTTPP
ncbi:hypothetical protein VTK73DRAFT_4913 [Phialemonium thermophilum]|uniref:Uncharacterized protein n=1 Tax=Phialemonium thermophilum TaxID=223376 RepID=A0ABR3V4Z2_9PEZI